MNSRGNRYPALYFRNFLSWNKPVEVASFDSTSQTYAVLANNYTFPGLSKILPPDQETCGFLDDKCDGMIHTQIIGLITYLLVISM